MDKAAFAPAKQAAMLKGLYDKVIVLSESRYALPTLAGVSFAESSFFPIPPDVILVPWCSPSRESAWLYGLVARLSVVGGMLGYAIGALLYDSVGHWLIAALWLWRSRRRSARSMPNGARGSS